MDGEVTLACQFVRAAAGKYWRDGVSGLVGIVRARCKFEVAGVYEDG